MINNKLTYISLFSSAGVGCYGFKQESFECIATNEIVERRLKIQVNNNKCKYDSAYISGDIKKDETKQKIYNEIEKWKKLGNDRVDVVIATPPCQGMSVANHKKNPKDIDRNSLINESVDIIKQIQPRFFVFENVAAFWKTGCVDKSGNIISIGKMITQELGNDYVIHNDIINFKNYGSNSSRTRTMVIGVNNSLAEDISPIELFPDYRNEKTLFEIIGDMKSLEWGEFDSEDFYHNFRTYPKHMRSWISGLKQGMTAFDNKEIINIPHRIIDGKVVINKSKNADKYTRQRFNNVGPCIHTRNDQLASQNTVHPIDDRVFSIRELMRMQTIPENFKWIDKSLDELNNLSNAEKRKLLKKEEMNIRQSIGESVATIIFRQIAHKIKTFMNFKRLTRKEILNLIEENKLVDPEELKKYVLNSIGKLSDSTISLIIELANSKRYSNSAYYTNKYIIQQIVEYLPDFNKDEITIIEPSVGSGNFLPFIFKKYEHIKKVNLILIDIDPDAIELLKIIYNKDKVPKNINISYVCCDFMSYEHSDVDLIIGNPPFTKLKVADRKDYLKDNYNKKATNLSAFILEKSLELSNNVSLIMPKNLLNTPEYKDTRLILSNYDIKSILDFGEKGFKGVLVETINVMINTKTKSKYTEVYSLTENLSLRQQSSYIFDDKLPYWVIYRNDFFDKVSNKMEFDIFDVFRDRQITNSNSISINNDNNHIRVLKSRNINDTGRKIIDIEGYDSFIENETLEKITVKKFLNNSDVYMTPNMTYKPRIMKKDKGYVVNGSIAILIPKNGANMTRDQMDYIASDEFRKFYKIARNYQTRSLNVDSASCYWFGINKEL